MSVIFVLSHNPDPRMNKRINLLKSIYKTTLVFWNRKTVEIWNSVHTDIETKEISISAAYANPLKRIISTCMFAIEAIRYLIKSNSKFIYTENIDMLVICSFYSFFKKNKPRIIYEIADLHTMIIDEPKSLFKRILRTVLITIEKRLCCRYVDLLVLTSDKYYDIYFKEFFSKERILIIPNMPNLYAFSSYLRKVNGKFTVGFIGAVRYKTQMKILLKAAENCGINVLFAGAGLDDEIKNLCIEKQNVEYYGKYDFDSDIASLYGKCDCIYSVYDADLKNVRVALPNKLYEAIYCELPIIVAKGTYLAELVESMGIGVAVSHTDSIELEQVLTKLALDKSYYNSLVDACNKQKFNINIEPYNIQLKTAIEDLS